MVVWGEGFVGLDPKEWANCQTRNPIFKRFIHKETKKGGMNVYVQVHFVKLQMIFTYF